MRGSRQGVASIVGTVVFVVVFMLAIGSLTYASELQSQASQGAALAQSVELQRARESVTFLNSPGGLAASDQGGSSVDVNHLVLRFANGTVYALNATASIPVGGEIQVQPLVPDTVCSPGSATCLSKYQTIVSGASPGSSVGLVTSLGNVFWYSASQSNGGWTKVVFDSSGTWTVPSGTEEAYVICVGGGGGGGGSGSATDSGGVAGSGGGGGGGVGSVAQGFVMLGGVAQVSVTVGAGGSAGSPGTQLTDGGGGGAGGGSAFGAFLACGGGGGGGGSPYVYNQGSTGYCYLSTVPPGGPGGGVPGGDSTVSGAASNALQDTEYGGGGGGGGTLYYPPGAGSPSSAMGSGSVFSSAPGTSGVCAFGGGGGSASPFANGGSGGNGATSCAGGQPGGAGAANSGAGGGGAGGAYSNSRACGYQPGGSGGAGGSGVVIVYYQ